MQKTGVYKKWVRTAGCSIPRVGDIEHPINQTQTPRTKKRSSLHEMEPNEEAPPLSALTKDKGRNTDSCSILLECVTFRAS